MTGRIADAAPGARGRLPRARGWLPRLLAFARSADEPAVLTRYQISADIAVAVTAAVVCLGIVFIAVRNPARVLPLLNPPLPAGAGWQVAVHAAPLVTARAMPLSLRRFRPLTAFWLCLAACMLGGLPAASAVNFFS